MQTLPQRKRTSVKELRTMVALKQFLAGGTLFPDVVLTEDNCAPGTWKNLCGEISFEEAKRIDAEYNAGRIIKLG